jgi:hypothetical protein
LVEPASNCQVHQGYGIPVILDFMPGLASREAFNGVLFS